MSFDNSFTLTYNPPPCGTLTPPCKYSSTPKSWSLIPPETHQPQLPHLRDCFQTHTEKPTKSIIKTRIKFLCFILPEPQVELCAMALRGLGVTLLTTNHLYHLLAIPAFERMLAAIMVVKKSLCKQFKKSLCWCLKSLTPLPHPGSGEGKALPLTFQSTPRVSGAFRC